ncbi:MAG: class I SAM-dependent methyltransferase, partial [Gluconacetobacter diazotrophicus]|nr:class I SAM-dependent methyltransferase [Gluconacetobacter diazotrophicus]
RFDADVERFSNLDTGQSATMDAPLALELVAQAAAASNPHARDLLDIGCGAGNYALRLLGLLPGMNVTLLDLSGPMLTRAAQRVGAATPGAVRTVQADIREVGFAPASFDLITAAAVFHHLRDDAQWHAVFGKCYAALRPGGTLWISDLVTHDLPAVQAVMWRRYGEYLVGLGGTAYRDRVFAYIELEDSPRSVGFQIDCLRAAGFAAVDVLHKHGCMATFAAFKADA